MLCFASDFNLLAPIYFTVLLDGGYILLLIISALMRMSASGRAAGIAMQRVLARAGWVLLAAVIFLSLPLWSFSASIPVILIVVTLFIVVFVNSFPKGSPDPRDRRPGNRRRGGHDPEDY